MDERWRPGPGAIGHTAAVGNNIITQFAVGRFNGRVNFIDRRVPLPIGYNQLEMVDQTLDTSINRELIRHRDLAVGVHVHGAGWQVFDGLMNDLAAFEHFFHANEIASVAIAFAGTDDFEIEILICQVRLILAQIADDAAGASDGAGAAQIVGVFLGQYANVLGAFDEDAIAIEQSHNVMPGLGEIADERPNHVDPSFIHIGQQPADAQIARMEALPGGAFANVVDFFLLIEGVEKSSETPEVKGRRAATEQVIVDTHQLVKDDAKILAARR